MPSNFDDPRLRLLDLHNHARRQERERREEAERRRRRRRLELESAARTFMVPSCARLTIASPAARAPNG